jgi:serine/threonine protein kinase
MEYPLISEYREAILAAEDNFNELSSLRPVLDGRGDPVMSSGNFAVVFKMRDSRDGTFYAVKCFIKDQKGRDEGYRKIADELDSVSSSYILPLRYLEDELFVDSAHCDTEEFPVVVMEWVEGETLDRYIKRNLSDVYSLAMLSYRFNRMAAWLMAQPFAHGDLKPDNILVRHDGSLVLVDYDGMYVPAMKGEKARETGSPDYRHPLRSSDDFNEQIDDFPIALIAMSLKAIALNPGLKRNEKYTLLLNEADFRDIAKSETMAKIQALSTDSELSLLLGTFHIALAKNSLDLVSFRLFMTAKLKKEENLSTVRTDEDLKNGIEDEYGVIYSKDGKRLLKCNKGITEYNVKRGTRVICNEAFGCCSSLQSIVLPDSVTEIGDEAFVYCQSLQSINLPLSLITLGSNPFEGCSQLQLRIPQGSKFELINSLLIDAGRLVSCLNNDKDIQLPESVTEIGDRAFYGCDSLQNILLSDSVIKIGDEAFGCCESLQSIVLPDSVIEIGDGAFLHCRALRSINLPLSLITLGRNPFIGCRQLQLRVPQGSKFELINSLLIDVGRLVSCLNNDKDIQLPESVTEIGDMAFNECDSLQNILLHDSVAKIGEEAFMSCGSLQSIVLPDSVNEIGDKAFGYCRALRSIVLPDSLAKIGNYAFIECSSLQSVNLPESLISIGENPFYHCKQLQLIVPERSKFKLLKGLLIDDNGRLLTCLNTDERIEIPDSVKEIGESAFGLCRSLRSIVLPDSVTKIDNAAFEGCNSLQSIVLPDSVSKIGNGVFRFCFSMQRIEVPKSLENVKFEGVPSDCKIVVR